MSEKHIGKVIQVIGPVLDIQFKDGELPELLNAIEIDNHGQIKPAFTSAKIRDVTHPLLIRAAGVKVLLQQIL